MSDLLSKLYASKTTIIHVLTFAAGLLAYLNGSELVQSYPEAVAIGVSALGAINTVLHLFPADPAPAAK